MGKFKSQRTFFAMLLSTRENEEKPAMTFEEFLTKHLNDGKPNFYIGCFTAKNGKLTFYIHPYDGGETLFVECSGNELKIDYQLPEGIEVSHK